MPPVSKTKKKRKRTPKPDGRRGELGLGGWWITVVEAREYTIGKQEWWTRPGNNDRIVPTPGNDDRIVPLIQYDPMGSCDKPIWRWMNGDMHLGPWKRPNQKNNNNNNNEDNADDDDGVVYPVEHGFGITYNSWKRKWVGKIYVGEFDHGHCHGSGKSFWLESSPSWKDNCFPGSEIRQLLAVGGGGTRNKHVSRPYTYSGRYDYGIKDDPSAMVTLKDGTTRVGPWEGGFPVGDWWTTHRIFIRPREERGSFLIERSNDHHHQHQNEHGDGASQSSSIQQQSSVTACASTTSKKRNRARGEAPTAPSETAAAAKNSIQSITTAAVPRLGARKNPPQISTTAESSSSPSPTPRPSQQ